MITGKFGSSESFLIFCANITLTLVFLTKFSIAQPSLISWTDLKTNVSETTNSELVDLRKMNQWFETKRDSLRNCCQLKVPSCSYQYRDNLPNIFNNVTVI